MNKYQSDMPPKCMSGITGSEEIITKNNLQKWYKSKKNPHDTWRYVIHIGSLSMSLHRAA